MHASLWRLSNFALEVRLAKNEEGLESRKSLKSMLVEYSKDHELASDFQEVLRDHISKEVFVFLDMAQQIDATQDGWIQRLEPLAQEYFEKKEELAVSKAILGTERVLKGTAMDDYIPRVEALNTLVHERDALLDTVESNLKEMSSFIDIDSNEGMTVQTDLFHRQEGDSEMDLCTLVSSTNKSLLELDQQLKGIFVCLIVLSRVEMDTQVTQTMLDASSSSLHRDMETHNAVSDRIKETLHQLEQDFESIQAKVDQHESMTMHESSSISSKPSAIVYFAAPILTCLGINAVSQSTDDTSYATAFKPCIQT